MKKTDQQDTDSKKEESFGMQQARRRPMSYKYLSPEEQWEIDKALGILDWDGK